MYIYIYIYIYTHMPTRRCACSSARVSPSHRRGTLKGAATVKSPTNHQQITFKSLQSNLFLEPLLAYPFRGTVSAWFPAT